MNSTHYPAASGAMASATFPVASAAANDAEASAAAAADRASIMGRLDEILMPNHGAGDDDWSAAASTGPSSHYGEAPRVEAVARLHAGAAARSRDDATSQMPRS